MCANTHSDYTPDQLRDMVHSVPDFPKLGVMFRDIMPLFADARALASMIKHMAKLAPQEFDCIAGIEARGFLLGVALAMELGKSFVPLRKPGKLPAGKLSESYGLEYGQSTLEVHKEALRNSGSRVWIVDDLLATGGTLEAACKLVEGIGGTVVGITVLIELTGLDGWKALGDYPHGALFEMDA